MDDVEFILSIDEDRQKHEYYKGTMLEITIQDV
jgi:hypothetical protein